MAVFYFFFLRQGNITKGLTKKKKEKDDRTSTRVTRMPRAERSPASVYESHSTDKLKKNINSQSHDTPYHIVVKITIIFDHICVAKLYLSLYLLKTFT